MRAVLILIPILLLLPALAMAAPLAETGGNISAGGIGGNITQICGDGSITGSESCDGTNLNGQTCTGLGYVSGTLTCTASCTFNTSACSSGGGGGGPSGGGGSLGGGGTRSCPNCSAPTAWSTCADSNQSRTNYRCNATTNYTCKSYTETQVCTMPPSEQPTVTEADASAAIATAAAAIQTAKSEGKDVSGAESTFAEAQNAFGNQNWAVAKNLADSAAESARNAHLIQKEPMGAALPSWLPLVVGAAILAAAFGMSTAFLRYEHIIDVTKITAGHAGKRVVLHGTLDPIKKYQNGDIVFRLHNRMIAVGKGITPRPSARYRVWGKVQMMDKQPYLRIHRLQMI